MKDHEELQAKHEQETHEKEKQEKSLNKSFNALKKNLQALEKQMPLPLVPPDANQNTKKVSRKRSSSSIDSQPPKLPRCPTSLKVTKINEGAFLAWSPPVNTEITEYVVSLNFGSVYSQVYKGKLPECTIYNCTLAEVLFFG